MNNRSEQDFHPGSKAGWGQVALKVDRGGGKAAGWVSPA